MTSIIENQFPSLLYTRQATPEQVSQIMSVGYLSTWIGMVLFGILFDKCKTHLESAGVTIVCASMFLKSLSIFGIAVCYNLDMMYLLKSLESFISGGYITTDSAMWFGMIPLDCYTTAVGIGSAAIGIAAIIASPFVAIFYDLFGDYLISFCTTALFGLCSGICYAIVCFLIKRRQ